MNEYRVEYGWQLDELTATTLTAPDFAAACIAARTDYASAWTHVIVTDPTDDRTLDVSKRRSHGTLTPAEWVTAALAPPVLVPIVSIDQFLDALKPQILSYPGATSDRPVWILLNGMLYAPAQIGLDPEFGAAIIVPAEEPSATHRMAYQPDPATNNPKEQ